MANIATYLARIKNAILGEEVRDSIHDSIAAINQDVGTANTNASNAVSTANSASTAASQAVSTANAASEASSQAVETANAAKAESSTASSNAQTALDNSQAAKDAAAAANAAAGKANEATTTANAAAANANAKATAAETATSAANTAADAANKAAENLTTIISEAESATEAANTAAETAESKATEATTAATQATEAATKATEATTAANTAAGKANEATTAANAAAANANTKATAAETATSAANTAANAANKAAENLTAIKSEAENATEAANAAAETAAMKANEATTAANEATTAATKANEATTAANTAAANANAKATAADTATSAANTAADAANEAAANAKPTIFGSFSDFPRPGNANQLYVDSSSDPRSIYTWNEGNSEYVLTGGAGEDLSSNITSLGTRITALETDATSFDNAWTHRTKFRGKSLGNALTADQKAAIKAGTFKDLYLGDYWSINSHTWRIADMDYWYGSGDTSCTTHHVVVIPDSQLYAHNMNTQNVTTGGYTGSEMYQSGLEQAKQIVTQDFGTNVLSHRELFTNTIASEHASNGTWFDSTVDLPNEIMMYGSYIFTPGVTDTVITYLYTIDKTQLALMQVAPFYINPARQNIWLRDVVSASRFAAVAYFGYPYSTPASAVVGVRPVVGITG